jgi:hypothetical protein
MLSNFAYRVLKKFIGTKFAKFYTFFQVNLQIISVVLLDLECGLDLVLKVHIFSVVRFDLERVPDPSHKITGIVQITLIF